MKPWLRSLLVLILGAVINGALAVVLIRADVSLPIIGLPMVGFLGL